MSKVNIVQKEGEELVVDAIATDIKNISEGVKKLKSGRLNDVALVYLIHKASGVPQHVIREVIKGMENLEKQFLKPKT